MCWSYCVFTWGCISNYAKNKEVNVVWCGLAFLGEVIFSIVFSMYEYRLANVPNLCGLWGTVWFTAAVFYIHKEKVIQHPQNDEITSRCCIGE